MQSKTRPAASDNKGTGSISGEFDRQGPLSQAEGNEIDIDEALAAQQKSEGLQHAPDPESMALREDQLEEQAVAARHRPDERPPNTYEGPGAAGGETNSAGTPAGGTAVGGLAGTNIGEGAPGNADLEEAAATGQFDVDLEQQEELAYAGRAGGAVGGTPAGKRASGGRGLRGLTPGEPGKDSTVGTNPRPASRAAGQKRNK